MLGGGSGFEDVLGDGGGFVKALGGGGGFVDKVFCVLSESDRWTGRGNALTLRAALPLL